MALPQFTMSELLEAGVHFGHRTFRWNPQSKKYIFGARNGVHIMDLTQTVPALMRAMTEVERTVSRGGRVLFVGTKAQASAAVAAEADRCGMFYMAHRWMGGTLTNWKTLNNSIKRLKTLEVQFEESKAAQEKLAELANAEDADTVAASVNDPMGHLTKKERLMLSREYTKLDRSLGGIKNMNGLPDIMIVMDVAKDAIAIDEANRLGIPVIGIVDSNTTDRGLTYPIPGNDDSTRAIKLYTRLFSDAVLSGIEKQASGKTTVTRTAAPKAKAAKQETVVTLSPKAKEAAKKAEEAPAEVAAAATKAPKAEAAAK